MLTEYFITKSTKSGEKVFEFLRIQRDLNINVSRVLVFQVKARNIDITHFKDLREFRQQKIDPILTNKELRNVLINGYFMHNYSQNNEKSGQTAGFVLFLLKKG